MDEQASILLMNPKEEMAGITLSLHAKQPKRATLSYDRAYIEIFEYPRASEAVITWTEDGKVICYVTFELNDAEILLHRPVETWHSGKHILSLYYPIENVVPNITNTFNVYLRMENGSGTVGIGDCIASISGQAMAAAAAWDGKITIEESAGLFAIGGGLQVKNYADVMAMETMELVQRSYSDTIAGRTSIGAFCRPVTLA